VGHRKEDGQMSGSSFSNRSLNRPQDSRLGILRFNLLSSSAQDQNIAIDSGSNPSLRFSTTMKEFYMQDGHLQKMISRHNSMRGGRFGKIKRLPLLMMPNCDLPEKEFLGVGPVGFSSYFAE
jgi:hypothetical protein